MEPILEQVPLLDRALMAAVIEDRTINLPERNSLLNVSESTPRQNWGSFQAQAVIVPQRLAPNFQAGQLAGAHVELHFTQKNAASLRLILVGDTVIGRSGAAVNLDYFNAAALGVSREHIMLRPSKNKLYLLDLGSTNGTLLNGIMISASRAYPLRARDVITVGKLSFTLNIVGIGKSNQADQEFRSRPGEPFA
jgi:pSer/pThr/pTyr-binding forkhead associated (FHA) protein